MTKWMRIGLVVSFTWLLASAYSPAVLANKKDKSNSNSDDDKNNDNNKQQKYSNQQNFQKYQQQNSQNSKFKSSNNNSQQFQNGQQGNQFQSQQQSQGGQKWQNFQKQGNGPQFGQKQNNSQNDSQKANLPVIKDKPDWISKSHSDKKQVNNFVVKFGGQEPFSEKWYKDHPHAWHHDHHDHDAWKYVTAAGVVGFLGWELYHPHSTVVVYEPVPYDTLFVGRPGYIIDPSRGEWMPLGVFSIMMGPGDMSTRMLDLSIDRFGHIRGSYYDMVSNATYNVAGIVDQRSQYAQWSLESNRQLTFYTPLGEMMQPQGAVYVQLPSGERQQWQLVRMENGGY